MNLQIPGWLQLFDKNIIWRKKTSEKVIYLTFDDGPVPEVTPLVLKILDEFSWKATFFCVGENVEKYPDLYNDLIKRGHRTGNHTFNHLKGFKYSTGEYVENVRKASEFIPSKLFRPPYGRITFGQYKALKNNYQIVMWDVITYDYNSSLPPEKVLDNVKNNLRSGSLVVFHDSNKAKDNVLKVLPMAIKFWTENGYTFGLL